MADATNAASGEAAQPDRPQPLAGLRVLDLSQVMAGPFCCMLLGDMGADVIKVEPPSGGDQTRKSMGFRMKGDDSPGFLALNRNKRSVTINLKTEAGRAFFYDLVKTADIVVENSRPGVTKRLGVDYDTLAAINPRVVYASISGFGQTGPWSQRPGFDLIAQAMSGVISAMGRPGETPVKSGVPIADLGAGMFAVYGILSAIHGRHATGRGQYVDTSLFEAAVGLSVWETTELWSTGRSPQPLGTANRMSAPYQAFAASDGWFVLGAANQRIWLKFVAAIGREDLAENPLYLENRDRLANLSQLTDDLNAVFATNTVDHWVDLLIEAGIPAGPINDYTQAMASDHVADRRMKLAVPHPVEGEFNALGFPVKLSDTPQSVRYPPPLLGQHTRELVDELGDPDRFETLKRDGAFEA